MSRGLNKQGLRRVWKLGPEHERSDRRKERSDSGHDGKTGRGNISRKGRSDSARKNIVTKGMKAKAWPQGVLFKPVKLLLQSFIRDI